MYGVTTTNKSSAEVLESIVKRGVSVSLGEAFRIRFPSVLLQPLGHLSVLVESTVYGPVAEPETPNCVRNCVRPPNVLRSLTAIWSRLATEVRCNTTVGLRPSSIERDGRRRLRRTLLPANLECGLVVPQRNEFGVSQVILARPLEELDLRDQHGLQPPTVRHLCGC